MRSIYQSPLGPIIVDCEDGALTGLRFADGDVSGDALPDGEVRRWLDDYFGGHVPAFTPPLLLRGTEFQQRVWQELLRVPHGQTVTYAELARRVGCRSARAVGGTVGRNPVALVVPCHRVVGSGGSLTGYAYGLARKLAMLDLEAR